MNSKTLVEVLAAHKQDFAASPFTVGCSSCGPLGNDDAAYRAHLVAEALRAIANDQDWLLTKRMDGEFLFVECGHSDHVEGEVGISDARPTDVSLWMRDALLEVVDQLSGAGWLGRFRIRNSTPSRPEPHTRATFSGCDNFTEPYTCLDAGTSETGRCDGCRLRRQTAIALEAQPIRAAKAEALREAAVEVQAAKPPHMTRDYTTADAAYDNAARILRDLADALEAEQ